MLPQEQDECRRLLRKNALIVHCTQNEEYANHESAQVNVRPWVIPSHPDPVQTTALIQDAKLYSPLPEVITRLRPYYPGSP